MNTSGFTIHWPKLQEVRRLVHAEINLSDDAIDGFILADWPEGKTHQTWLDNATVGEIAGWVITGLHNGYLPEEAQA